MSILIHDTARNNLAGWTVNAVSAGYARGAVLSPFSSPVRGNGYKVDASAIASRIIDAGGEFWFDATTHALDMPDVGDFRYYDEWDLWPVGERGKLDTETDIRYHIERVFAIQNSLSARLLAPTRLLHSAQSTTSQHAFELARVAQEEAGDQPLWLSVVGDTHFWSAGTELDAHIGMLDQLEPAGWMLTVARPQSAFPTSVPPSEITGLMRTVYALSEDYEVVVGHGDLAALPAVAAGAVSVGTGWDVRQRVCAYTDYAIRVSGTGAGQWFQRPTLESLLGSLVPGEYRVLVDQDPTLADRLTPGTLSSGPENAFRQHATVLSTVIDELVATPAGPQRVQQLRARYVAAQAEWQTVQRITGSATGANQWIDPLVIGLDQFTTDEGW